MKRIIAVLLMVLTASVVPAMAGQTPAGGSTITVRPTALGPLVENQKIKLMLKDGTYVEGKVVLATEDELQMNVKSVEPKGRINKGETRIPTRDISVVYMKKSGSVALPIFLGVAGGFGGLLAGAYAAYEADSPGLAVGLGIGLTAAGATGGAYLGVEAAKRTVTINVIAPKETAEIR